MEKFSWTKSVSFSILHIVWKFQLDRTNNKEMGGKGGPNLIFFNVYFHYLFIYSSISEEFFFPILLVCEECWVFLGGNVP